MATYRRTKLAADAFRGFTSSRAIITKPEPISRVFSTKSPSKPAGFSSILHNRIPKSTHESSHQFLSLGKRYYHNEHPGQRGAVAWLLRYYHEHCGQRGIAWCLSDIFERHRPLFFCLGVVVISYLMSTTETVPYTNRRHAVFHGPGRLPPKTFCKLIDNILGFSFEFLPASHPESVRVNLIFKHIIDALNTKLKLDGTAPGLVGFDWEVAVADSGPFHNWTPFHKTLSTTSTHWSESSDGSKIVVYRECLERLTSDAEIAAIICHEVAHTVAGHDREWKTFLVAIFWAMFLAFLPREFSLWFNRRELEADQIAILLIASAGYDPNVAPIVYGKFEKSGCGFHHNLNLCPLSGEERAEMLARANIMEEARSIYHNVRAAKGVEESHFDYLKF